MARKKRDKRQVRPVNKPLMTLIFGAVRLYFYLCGVRVKKVNKIGKPETPAILLCNHGSFIDFVYAQPLVGRFGPNFIVARLYFYDKRLGWLLRQLGGFPKSMFALDMESTKNSLRVLKNGGLLAMMPEARLSTAGQFEDIQEGTFSFIKKSGVPVYTLKFNGDYFADPKWGKGIRRGAQVEAELDILYTAQQVQQLTTDQIKAGIVQRLDYDEFAWLAQRPKVRYRCRRLAEGLENILTRCPNCGKRHTIITEKRRISCENCGFLTNLDDRYGFDKGFRFENLSQWYAWQTQQLAQEIAQDPAYALTSPVELRLPSRGKGLTRHSGQGTCTLSREGLTYQGTQDGQQVQLHYPMDRIYRLLFGAGQNFELYDGTKILFFVPQEKRSAVDWYSASIILRDEVSKL